MAAITTRLLLLRPTPRPYPLSLHHHFSTSSDGKPPPPQPDSESPPKDHIKNPQKSFSSYFKDVQSSLKNQPPSPKSPLFDELSRNLRRSVTPPPSPNNAAKAPARESPPSISSMSDRIRQMTNSGTDSRGPSVGSGGGFNFPNFNMRGDKMGDGVKFFRSHKHSDLGKKLQGMRPTNREGKWFSLQELSDRLARVKEIEEKKSLENGGIHLKGLRESLIGIHAADVKNDKLRIAQKLDRMSQLGGTPQYMLHPPKEELVQQYFHPDMMSSAEKMKLELKKVRDEFKMSESDCGSTRVQIAQLTTKIKHLSSVLAKKDKHSRKGLLAMVQQRKKLLKYLRRTDWESYSLVLSKLGLRDNPDVKA